jgi:hypothetical protein
LQSIPKMVDRNLPEFLSVKPKKLVTTCMSSTYLTISNFLERHALDITHTAVAHTRYKTFERTEHGMKRIVELAKQDFRHFRNCFNKRLYGRSAVRKPLTHQPLLIATLEGSLVTTNRDLTLHYNFALGHLPKGMSDTELLATFRDCWVVQAKQRDDIRIVNIAGQPELAKGWIGYSLKEAEKRGNTEVWDFMNTQIPYSALDAG